MIQTKISTILVYCIIIINFILEKEMIKLVQNNNQMFYKNDRIYFKSENCQKNIKFVLEHLSKIEKEIIIQLKLLINNLENKTFPIHDQVMIFDLEGFRFNKCKS